MSITTQGKSLDSHTSDAERLFSSLPAIVQLTLRLTAQPSDLKQQPIALALQGKHVYKLEGYIIFIETRQNACRVVRLKTHHMC
jgi:hypothetical protein